MPRQDIKDLGEDATGFGATELRTLWRSIVRPAEVLEAYMTGGPTGHDEFTRPLRLYLALCGLMMLVAFAMGGVENMLSRVMTPEMLAPILEASGKTRDAFIADADGWVSLCLVPIMSACLALTVAPLMRWWDAENLGWRKAFRATFAYLNAWTILILPFCWTAYYDPAVIAGQVVFFVAGVVTFIRMGRGRWWRTWLGAVMKSIGLIVALQVASAVGGLILGGVGVLGGMFGA